MTHPKWKTKDEFPGSISIPYGVKVSHTWHEIGQLLRIINDLDVYSFAEIGFHVGGLASIMGPRSRYAPFRYVGFDVTGEHIMDEAKSMYLFHIMDVFADPDIVWGLSKNQKTFIYCDGGDKAQELVVFAKYLDPGDIIACHDYWDAQDVYEIDEYGLDGCAYKPEVFFEDIRFLMEGGSFNMLPDYLLEGTRIMGFQKA